MMAKPCLDGFWYVDGENNITEIKGVEGQRRQLWEFDMNPIQEGSKCTLTYGEFHEVTSKEIKEKTGAKHYDLEMKLDFFVGQMVSIYGVVSKDVKTMYFYSKLQDKMTTVNKLSPQKKEELLEARTHEDELIPPGFTPQPNLQGKIMFICGPPGAGKSTTAQYLAKEKGWIYYEADCFPQCLDPFVALDAKEPSIAQMRQKPIKVYLKSFLFLRLLFQSYFREDLQKPLKL